VVTPNTSASGGPLQPAPVPAPLEGEALQIFLQNWLAPLCNLPGNMVRPRWQPEPDNVPTSGTAWMAMGLVPERHTDTFPALLQSSDGSSIGLQRQEEIHLLCSFYDLGSTGQADANASLLRDNLAVPQNWEPLIDAGFMFAYVGDMTTAPVLLATRWLYRMDLPVVIRRQINRTYPVLDVLSMNGEIETDSGLDFPISAGPVT
jgi:hypothetical protein